MLGLMADVFLSSKPSSQRYPSTIPELNAANRLWRCKYYIFPSIAVLRDTDCYTVVSTARLVPSRPSFLPPALGLDGASWAS